MIEIIEIIISVIVIGLLVRYWTYFIGFFEFIPMSIMGFVLFLIALNVVLFIIHRK